MRSCTSGLSQISASSKRDQAPNKLRKKVKEDQHRLKNRSFTYFSGNNQAGIFSMPGDQPFSNPFSANKPLNVSMLERKVSMAEQTTPPIFNPFKLLTSG